MSNIPLVNHYIRSKTAERTECGRYITDLYKLTTDPAQVTCRACLMALARAHVPQPPSLADYAALLAGRTCEYDSTPLPARVDTYDHKNGWNVAGFAQRQWLSVQCPKCKYEWSLTKLGIPRPCGNITPKHTEESTNA